MLVNQVRGVLKSAGAKAPRCSPGVLVRRVRESMPEALRPALEPLLEQIEVTGRVIKGYDAQLEMLCQDRYPETELLRQVPGVGVKTALCFVLTVEDPGRFRRSREVGAYLGMVPMQRDSGARQRKGRITKHGDVMCRRLLVQSAQYILGPFGPDCDLRRWGEHLMRGGDGQGKKQAVVGVARKLAVLLHRLWVTGEVYDPDRQRPDALAA